MAANPFEIFDWDLHFHRFGGFFLVKWRPEKILLRKFVPTKSYVAFGILKVSFGRLDSKKSRKLQLFDKCQSISKSDLCNLTRKKLRAKSNFAEFRRQFNLLTQLDEFSSSIFTLFYVSKRLISSKIKSIKSKISVKSKIDAFLAANRTAS